MQEVHRPAVGPPGFQYADPEHLRLVMDATPIAILVVDATGTIARVNSHVEALFGYTRDELVGHSIEMLVPTRSRGLHPDLREGYLGEPTTRAMGAGRDLFGLCKDGSEVPVEIGLNPIKTSQGDYVLAAIIDITERKHAAEHLRLVVEAAPNAMVVVDRSGAISLINAQVENLFGYTRDELLGRSVEELVPERFRGAHPLLRGEYLRAPTTRAMGAGRHLFGLRKDGSEVPIEIGLNPISTPKGEFVLASIIDITERKHAEELRIVSAIETQRRLDAEAARDRAVDASQLKSQFVATMSHELRTPLNAIIGMAELLSATSLEERQRSYVEAINESAEALLSIIKSILDFSKIEAGKLELEARDFDLSLVVEGAASVLSSQARQKRLTIHTYVDPLIPPLVRGDDDQLRQIFLNLVGNAVKFTQQGHVVVRALPVETSSRHVVVRFEVQDTGIGIDTTTQAKLFEPFVQADGSSSRRYGGTGLGLSISKRLVQLMGGEIGVVSEPGSGSLFWFTSRFARPSGVSSSRKIFGAFALVVTHDDLLAQIVTGYVEAWGISSRRAASVDEVNAALQATAGQSNVDCVAIVDTDTESATAVAALQRAAEQQANLRIIMVGSEESVVKPIRQSQLFDSIVTAFAHDEDVAAAAEAASCSSQPAEPSSQAVADGELGAILVAEDNPSLQELLVHQFSRLGYRVTIVADGLQVVDAARRERFALIFMDCQMPNMDGFEATRRIREQELHTGEHVPIVAVTANAFKEDRESCLAVGMDDYLSKPVRIDELRAMVERWLRRPESSSTGVT
ncbi:MAG TPA: PAS domain S-box protein [Candidatus Limnocylindria bacterium]|nr:PAS domain S-box protein [Candidatus Limnocylindria bacterium]